MQTKNIKYPQYRKYSNGKSYFKIISPTKFEEILTTGNKLTLHVFDAKILPDRNYIYDLTYNYTAHWERCNAKKFELMKEKVNYS